MRILKFLLLSVFFIALNSCSSDSDGNGGTVESITITPNFTTQATGNAVKFVVKTNTNKNVTAESVISVEGINEPLNDGSLTANEGGSYTITANYAGFTATTTVVFVDAPFAKRVLIEDYTGTWCGYCPRVSQGIDLVMAQTNYAVPVAIHRGQDPYNFAGASVLEDLIGLQGYPTAMLNRLTDWNYPEPSNVAQVVALTQGDVAKVGLAMKATVSGGNIDLNIKVQYAETMTDTKLVVYVLENGLIYNQVNYTSFFGGGSTIVGFEHNHVLRACLTNIMGDDIPNSNSTNNGSFDKNFTVPVPANIANSANLEIVAFVVGADKKALNVRKVVNGEDQISILNQ